MTTQGFDYSEDNHITRCFIERIQNVVWRYEHFPYWAGETFELYAKTEFGLLLNAFQQVFQLNWSTTVILRCDIACSQMTGTICRPKDVRLCRGNACEGSAGYDCGRSLE